MYIVVIAYHFDTNNEREKSKNEETIMNERIELRILQYNVNKSRKNVMILLL